MRNCVLRLINLFFVSLLVLIMVGCGNANKDNNIEENEDLIVIGFSQVGAESDWRAANTESMKAAFTEANGYRLIFDDAQQKQTNQITAIRYFIQQEVDYIVLAPVTETGFDTVLEEAKAAGIPVILLDRMADVDNDNLFECWVGSDFELEAEKVCEWLYRYTLSENIAASDVHIVNIQGTIGSSAQIGRTNGLRTAVSKNGWDLCGELEGEFTKAKGYEAAKIALESYPSVNVIYCENDNEAFGAIEAIEDCGRTVGYDITGGEIMILSFDGVKSDALELLLEGKIACIGECNPLHGPRVRTIIENLIEGRPNNKFTYVDEELFCAIDITKTIFLESGQYDVSILDQAAVDKRRELFGNGHYSAESKDVY